MIQVGCIFSEMSDSDADNLKAVVWNATGNSVQVLISVKFVYLHYENCRLFGLVLTETPSLLI